MHSGNTVLPCITWCTYPVTWHAILLCDPLTLGWNTCFLPMADTMMEAAPIKLQWLCDWCMHGDKDATTLVLRSLLLLGLIHCVWFEHVSPKLHVSAQFTWFMIRHAWSKFMVTSQSYSKITTCRSGCTLQATWSRSIRSMYGGLNATVVYM